MPGIVFFRTYICGLQEVSGRDSYTPEDLLLLRAALFIDVAEVDPG